MRSVFIIAFAFILTQTDLNAQSHWTFELHGGEVYNVPLPLTISQQSYPDLKFTAHYNSESLILPVYWDWRFCRWENGKSWEFEVIHHKLYLENITPDVQKFNISHGFNMLLFNRGFDKGSFRYRAGAGLILAHPESTIRGQEFGNSTADWDTGYYISGPVLNLGIGKPIRPDHRLYVNIELKTTFAYSYIKIAHGNAHVYNLALHLNLGFGVNLTRPEKP